MRTSVIYRYEPSCILTARASSNFASKKYRPLFTCDTKCEDGKTCSDTDNWVAIPHSRFKRSKCDQDLVICANNNSTHAYIRDRSNREAWEVSRAIPVALGLSPDFRGVIHPDEQDPGFKKDPLCRPAKKAEESGPAEPSAVAEFGATEGGLDV